MKLFFSFILFCFSLVFVVSCIGRKPPEPVTIETTKTVREVVKDTVFKVEADSAFYYAWIDCQNGKPVLINTAQEAENYNRKNPGANAQPAKIQAGKNIQVSTILQNGKLNVNCHQEALNLFKSWKETYIKEHKKTTKPEYIEKPFRWYHKALMWTGVIALIALLISRALNFLKPF